MLITIQQSNILKTIAILMMLFLHLFNRPYEGLFEPLLFLGKQPLVYYISLFCDACVPIFLFVSGYGLHFKHQNKGVNSKNGNITRIFKLYLNYWVVILLFVVILGFLLEKKGYPGSLLKFILNFLGIQSTYNGSWWFLFTYILLTFSSPLLFKILEQRNSHIIIIIITVIYFISFYFQIYKKVNFHNIFLNWFTHQLALFGTSMFSFLMGALALKENWFKKVSKKFNKIEFKNTFVIIGIVILIIVHGLITNLVIAPFLAIPFIFLWCQIKLNPKLEKSLLWLSEHSTNIWFVHLFFMSIYFKEIIYAPKSPILILFWLFLCCIFTSFIINLFFLKPILNWYSTTKNSK